jgi:hypothetical protein
LIKKKKDKLEGDQRKEHRAIASLLLLLLLGPPLSARGITDFNRFAFWLCRAAQCIPKKGTQEEEHVKDKVPK